jgi:hypothetical protein
MWPSTWAAAGPSAMRRTVQVIAEQLMTIVWAPPSLATTSSPACIPARVSSAPWQPQDAVRAEMAVAR